MNHTEYCDNEWRSFLNQKCFFGNVAEFIEFHKDCDEEWFLEQLEWIEGGSYGAGACLHLQTAWNQLQSSRRANKPARIGGMLLWSLNGAPFTGWRKLPDSMKDAINSAVTRWIESEKNFAVTR